MPEKIRLGFIGAGGIARGHFRRLTEIPQAEVVAFADPSRKSIKAIRDSHPAAQKCKVFRDYRPMLETIDLDAVAILSPHTVHFQQAMDSLDAGLHCLIEKPMVCSPAEAKKIIAKAKQNNKVTVVSYQRRFEPSFRYMKQQLESGELGKTLFITGWQAQNWLTLTRGTWRQNPQLSGGGQLNDSGSHLVDILLWLAGEPAQEVCAFMDNLKTRVDILSALSIKFPSGTLANLSIIGHTAVGFHEDISVWCEKGNLHLRQGQLFQEGTDGRMLRPRARPRASNPNQHFINLILGKEEPQAPAECGLLVAQLTEAAYRSAQKGAPATVKT